MSSSPGSSSMSPKTGRAMRAKVSSLAPCSRSFASRSGARSRTMQYSRPRNACEWKTWGAPRRSHSTRASPGAGGRGASSCSSRVTRWPSCDSARPAPSPATLPPTTTTCFDSISPLPALRVQEDPEGVVGSYGKSELGSSHRARRQDDDSPAGSDPTGLRLKRPTAALLSHRGCPCSTIAEAGLNFRVRDGIGCGPRSMDGGKKRTKSSG